MKKSGRFVFYNNTKNIYISAKFALFSIAKLSKLTARVALQIASFSWPNTLIDHIPKPISMREFRQLLYKTLWKHGKPT